MSPYTTRWVFFISLLLLLPLPFYSGGIASLPVARVLFIVTAEAYLLLLGQVSGFLLGDIFLLSLEVVGWVVVLWFAVSAYNTYTSSWPSAVGGSVMGLVVFTLLILLSTFPAYRQLGVEQAATTFLQVYD